MDPTAQPPNVEPVIDGGMISSEDEDDISAEDFLKYVSRRMETAEAAGLSRKRKTLQRSTKRQRRSEPYPQVGFHGSYPYESDSEEDDDNYMGWLIPFVDPTVGRKIIELQNILRSATYRCEVELREHKADIEAKQAKADEERKKIMVEVVKAAYKLKEKKNKEIHKRKMYKMEVAHLTKVRDMELQHQELVRKLISPSHPLAEKYGVRE